MRLARFLSTSLVVGATTVATFFACGGDDGGGGGGGDNMADAFVYQDAKVFMDAPPGPTGLGSPCTPMGSGQGNCPDGYTCLALQDGSGPWCSKTCTRGAGDQCGVGYTGPGVANCFWDVQYSGSSATYQYCGVICQGTGACTASTCDGTCPGSMTCSLALGSSGGSGCQ